MFMFWYHRVMKAQAFNDFLKRQPDPAPLNAGSFVQAESEIKRDLPIENYKLIISLSKNQKSNAAS